MKCRKVCDPPLAICLKDSNSEYFFGFAKYFLDCPFSASVHLPTSRHLRYLTAKVLNSFEVPCMLISVQITHVFKQGPSSLMSTSSN